MLNFLDVYERVLKGPIMSEQDFDMKVFIPKLRRIVKSYEIKYGTLKRPPKFTLRCGKFDRPQKKTSKTTSKCF